MAPISSTSSEPRTAQWIKFVKLYPIISIRMSSENITDLSALDLSIKGYYIIVHYNDSDPGSEFEILTDTQVIGDSWDTLERGVEVVVKFGNAKLQATVVQVSDDLQYLQKNYKLITEEFLDDPRYMKKKKATKSGKKVAKGGPKKMCAEDKSTQTDFNDHELKADYEVLQNKYDNLLTLYHGVTSLLMQAGNHTKEAAGSRPAKDYALRPQNGLKNKEVDARPPIMDEKLVYIGTHKTAVPREMYETVNWLSYSAATRKLLISVFTRKVLATHSLTGKPSPAFLGVEKQAKMRLDPIKISDIVEVVSKKCHVSESIVRSAITTKCADENKMYRKRMAKEAENDENCEGSGSGNIKRERRS